MLFIAMVINCFSSGNERRYVEKKDNEVIIVCYCVHTFRTNVLKIREHRSREQSSKDINSYTNWLCICATGLQGCSARHGMLYGLYKINLNLYLD